MARVAFHCLDRRIERPQIQALGERPDQAHPMIRWQKIVQARGLQLDLPPLGTAQTRPTTRRTRRRRLFRQFGKQRGFVSIGRLMTSKRRSTMPTLAKPDSADSPKIKTSAWPAERFTGSERSQRLIFNMSEEQFHAIDNRPSEFTT